MAAAVGAQGDRRSLCCRTLFRAAGWLVWGRPLAAPRLGGYRFWYSCIRIVSLYGFAERTGLTPETVQQLKKEKLQIELGKKERQRIL